MDIMQTSLVIYSESNRSKTIENNVYRLISNHQESIMNDTR